MIEEIKGYRNKYKHYYGIEFDKEYVVHHIDFDRSNNDINNLILLPRTLHTKYHSSLSAICNDEHMIDGRIDRLGKYASTSFFTLGEALKEIEKWKKWKLFNYDPYLKTLIFDEVSNNG